jgi:hypothetical protein
MLPWRYLERGVAAVKGVGKLVTPVHVGGVATGETGKGTGWLLTTKHVVTCRHVMHAREDGDAVDDDLALQVEATTFELDDKSHEVAACVAVWKDIDVAILELATAIDGPAALVCRDKELVPPAKAGFYVNVIQYPDGRDKMVGLRSNAALEITDDRVYYFTDTDQGSSGGPCLDDDWLVIAVHRGAQARPKLEYLGRKVGYVNVGSRMSVVLARLAAEHPMIHALLRRG